MLVDSSGRVINYLRLSVTDRCNLRCSYCMGEDVVFVPRDETLRTDELVRLCGIFCDLGIRSIRLTGGEPLVRPHVLTLAQRLGEFLRAERLEELTLTTNGSLLPGLAKSLYEAGIRRVNVSLDSLDSDIFHKITKHDLLAQVLAGIQAALAAGMSVRVNTVVLAGVNDHEISRLVAWCGLNGCDMSLIEAMPLGGMASAGAGAFLSLDQVKDRLDKEWSLVPSEAHSAGPSRYFTVEETGRKLGFISPLSHGFCATCNRVRLTCTGRLHLCLAHEAGVDLRDLLRSTKEDAPVKEAILAAMARKPDHHDFTSPQRILHRPAPMWRLGG